MDWSPARSLLSLSDLGLHPDHQLSAIMASSLCPFRLGEDFGSNVSEELRCKLQTFDVHCSFVRLCGTSAIEVVQSIGRRLFYETIHIDLSRISQVIWADHWRVDDSWDLKLASSSHRLVKALSSFQVAKSTRTYRSLLFAFSLS